MTRSHDATDRRVINVTWVGQEKIWKVQEVSKNVTMI